MYIDKIKRDFLKSVLLTQVLFDEYIKSSSDVELITLALNNSLCQAMIDELFEKNIPNMNINLLKHPKCSKHQIDKFIKLADKVYSIAIAHNESLNDAQFNALYHQNDFDVNVSLAYNVKTPIFVLKSLVILNNNFINAGLCSNTSTPINILKQFQFDERLKSLLSNNDTFKKFTRNTIGM